MTRPSPSATSPTAASLTRRLLDIRPASRSPPTSRAPSDLAPPEAVAGVIVHHSGCLHESVTDRRPHESEASPDEIPAHGARGIRLGGALAQDRKSVV